MSDLNNDADALLANLAKEALPDFNLLFKNNADVPTQITCGTSLFLKEYECASELAYKRQCMAEGRIMYHAHIGMNDAASTANALRHIHQNLDMQGFRLDRAGFALDRRMGLPAERRNQVPAETGPMLDNRDDWNSLAQSAPIQPHMGDFMIGQPASLINTIQALQIGCTTVGNLSQFFTFEAPGWDDTKTTALESCKAIVLLAQFRKQGAMLHSYLEDGFGALFKHCATVAGWALLERYIVEELLGARLTHCIGGLTSDPVKRAGWVLAVPKIHKGELVGSMIYGDTISFGPDFDKNRAVTAEYLLWDILTQIQSPSGHAVLPLPVTEAIRIPSAEEILQAQIFGRQIEKTARAMHPHISFNAAEAFADSVVSDGELVFQNALTGLKDAGVDIRNPVQLMYVLKKLGAQNFESLFAPENSLERSIQTDMFLMSQQVIDDYRPMFATQAVRDKVKGKRLLLASTDVHAHAVGALSQLLSESGAQVTNLGAEQNPQNIIDALNLNDIDAVLLSTHNGMALDYARQLKSSMQSESIDLPVVFGGVLNQKVEDQILPVPVVSELNELGFHAAVALPNLPELLTQ